MTEEDAKDKGNVPVASSVRANLLEGEQRLQLEPGERLKVQTAAQRHELALRKQEHEQAEERKRNDREHTFRLIGFIVLMAILVVSIGWGGYAAVNAGDVETRNWGQDITLTLIGALGGGVAGFFTGRGTK